MAWMTNTGNSSGTLKPFWEYKPNTGLNFITVLPNTVRQCIMITDDNDPTGTWSGPASVWVHQFKSNSGYSTLICGRYDEACPLCYENEIFKQKNPNYKTLNQKLPYPVSLRALVQVYDMDFARVHWLLAGKKIIDGIEFIYSNPAMLSNFNGCIGIQRMGSGRDTSYAVQKMDMSLSEAQKEVVRRDAITKQKALELFCPSQQDIKLKSGIDSVSYFEKNIPLYPGIDISNWGSLPVHEVEQNQNPAIQNSQFQESGVKEQNFSEQQQTSVPSQKDEMVEGHLETICNTGMYASHPFREVVQSAGKSYLQYLRVNGITQSDKDIAKIILDDFEKYNNYILEKFGVF